MLMITFSKQVSFVNDVNHCVVGVVRIVNMQQACTDTNRYDKMHEIIQCGL
jgi:hypothetical protein